MKSHFKICGLTRMEDVDVAVEAGASALGFVLEPSSPRCVASRPDFLAAVACRHPLTPKVAVFGPLYDESLVPPGWWVQCSSGRPKDTARWIHTLRISPGAELPVPDSEAPLVILDPWDPEAHGGTGRRIPLECLAAFRAQADRPFLVAGGITPDNATEVLTAIQPYGLDCSSGVECSPGVKDGDKIRKLGHVVANFDEFQAKKGRDR